MKCVKNNYARALTHNHIYLCAPQAPELSSWSSEWAQMKPDNTHLAALCCAFKPHIIPLGHSVHSTCVPLPPPFSHPSLSLFKSNGHSFSSSASSLLSKPITAHYTLNSRGLMRLLYQRAPSGLCCHGSGRPQLHGLVAGSNPPFSIRTGHTRPLHLSFIVWAWFVYALLGVGENNIK